MCDLGLKNRGAGRVEGAVAVTITGNRVGVTSPEEAISTSVAGVWTQLAAAIALLRAALPALRSAAVSGFVFRWRGTGRKGQDRSSAGCGPLQCRHFGGHWCGAVASAWGVGVRSIRKAIR